MIGRRHLGSQMRADWVLLAATAALVAALTGLLTVSSLLTARTADDSLRATLLAAPTALLDLTATTTDPQSRYSGASAYELDVLLATVRAELLPADVSRLLAPGGSWSAALAPRKIGFVVPAGATRPQPPFPGTPRALVLQAHRDWPADVRFVAGRAPRPTPMPGIGTTGTVRVEVALSRQVATTLQLVSR